MRNGLTSFLMLILSVALLAQQRYSVVIDEIMADPAPSQGLPANEWIELRNASASPIHLLNYRLGDANGISGQFPGFVLQPDSLVILCPTSSVTAMRAYGNVIGISNFPSLDNNGDEIFLRDAAGMTMHAVSYSYSWYQNAVKGNGGWSLEMIDPGNPCQGIQNWKAAIDPSGGTPGRKNSVDGPNPDQSGPSLIRTFANDSTMITLFFSESLDSNSAAITNNYTIDGGVSIAAAYVLPPVFDKVRLILSTPLLPKIVYKVAVGNVKDCLHNVSMGSSVKAGYASEAEKGDLLINEILFNPRPGGYDYVEFYNNSDKVLDISRLNISNNTSGTFYSIATSPFCIFPGEYLVVTEDAADLSLNYLVKDPSAVMEMTAFPSLPDDAGSLLLRNAQGAIVDDLHYDSDWHFKLIVNTEGIALEKIDPGAHSDDSENWESAASTAGYGTPGYRNSQYRLLVATARVDVSPRIFSPDNDGRDDFVSIQYRLEAPGYVANVSIFDANGRLKRMLVRNGTVGTEGHWKWDGLGENGAYLPIGLYVIVTGFFNLEGKVENFKNVVVLARQLR